MDIGLVKAVIKSTIIITEGGSATNRCDLFIRMPGIENPIPVASATDPDLEECELRVMEAAKQSFEDIVAEAKHITKSDPDWF